MDQPLGFRQRIAGYQVDFMIYVMDDYVCMFSRRPHVNSKCFIDIFIIILTVFITSKKSFLYLFFFWIFNYTYICGCFFRNKSFVVFTDHFKDMKNKTFVCFCLSYNVFIQIMFKIHQKKKCFL